jgi:replicative DNA helicase
MKRINDDSSSENQLLNEISKSYEAKVPPNSPEAEQTVLGAMMLDQSAIAKVLEVIAPESFYNLQNKRIFQTIVSMFERRLPVDIITLSDELIKTGEFEKLGGAAYLTELSRHSFAAENVESHARIVQERYLKRELIRTAGEIVNSCFDETVDVFDEIDKAEAKIFEIAEKRMSQNFVGLNNASVEVYKELEVLRNQKNKSGITGVPTGIHELDKMTSGFQKGDMIIVAARPSMGKTALALSIARNMSIQYEHAIAFFSLEMSYKPVTQRLLSAEARVDLAKIRSGQVNDDENMQIVNALNTLSHSQFFIDDSPMLTVLEIRAKARRLKAENNIQAIFVDYLQFINSPNAESRQREISIISSHLKQLAKELEIPVVALAQLNRAVEQRANKDKRPVLSDLRESGSIEQDADVVVLVHRPEYYGITELEDGRSTENLAELIIAKQRNGATGIVTLAFDKKFARFENLEYRDTPPEIAAQMQREQLNEIQNFGEQQQFAPPPPPMPPQDFSQGYGGEDVIQGRPDDEIPAF